MPNEPSTTRGVITRLRRVPWIVWALLAPAVIIGAVRLWTGGATRVPVVGAGVLARVSASPKPEGGRYDLRVQPEESLDATARRVDGAIAEWADVIVFGFDASQLTSEAAEAQAMAHLARLTRRVENAAAVPVVVGFAPTQNAPAEIREAAERVNAWWRKELCPQAGLRLCLDLAPHVGDAAAIQRAVGTAVEDALGRHAVLRASTRGEEARVLPHRDGFWGVAIGMYPDEAERRGFAWPPDLGEVAALGATHVLVPVAAVVDGVNGSKVSFPAAPGTVSEADVRRVLRSARAAGLGTAVMAQVEVRGGGPRDWRGRLAPAEPDAWWASYRRFVARLARIAHEEGADLLAIGNELRSLTGTGSEGRWAEVARAARAHFSGSLTYGTNHDALDATAPFRVVDYVGVSAYFPLSTDGDAPERDLQEAWAGHMGRLRGLSEQTDKPILLLEVGYPSVDGGAVRPWDYTTGAPLDLEEQRRAYAALAHAVGEAPFVHGAFAWSWFGPGGPHCRWYTPRGKPAEQELARLLRRGGEQPLSRR
jgi:hypothetical protein